MTANGSTLAVVPAGVLRRRWAARLAAAATLAAAGVLLYHFDPAAPPAPGRFHYFPVCLLHECTGFYCPGCGATRATHELLHLHLAAAFRYNALFVASLPLLAWVGWRQVRRALWPATAPRPLGPRWTSTAMLIALAFGVVRNIPCRPFVWLAPHRLAEAPVGGASPRVVRTALAPAPAAIELP